MSEVEFTCFCSRIESDDGGGSDSAVCDSDCDKPEVNDKTEVGGDRSGGFADDGDKKEVPPNVNANVKVLPPPVAFYDKSAWREMAAAKKLPVVHPEVTSYDQFFSDFIVNNVPCLLSREVTDNWLSRRKWVKKKKGDEDEGEEEIDFEFMLQIYGDEYVSVVNCDDSEYKEGYGGRDSRIMFFREYVDYWRKLISSRKEPAKGEGPDLCLYLKDWHIVRCHQSRPEIASAVPYETPVYFSSDFLNEYCSQMDSDDFKFCYMGPQGSFTSFHADVYGSYSWSANVFGVKKWFLYPPGNEMRFYDDKAKKLSFDWDEPGIEGEDYLEVIQEAGECIFVPSGWHHVVWNVTDAISINHNWFNGANLTYIWNVLRKELNDVEVELDDLSHIPEFKEQCQLVLKANHGMNYEDFFKLIKPIKSNREKGDASISSSSPFQLKYDLDAIHHLVREHCSRDPATEDYFQEA